MNRAEERRKHNNTWSEPVYNPESRKERTSNAMDRHARWLVDNHRYSDTLVSVVYDAMEQAYLRGVADTQGYGVENEFKK